MMTNFLLGQVQVPVDLYGATYSIVSTVPCQLALALFMTHQSSKYTGSDLMLCSFRMYSFQDCWIASLLFSAFYTISKQKFSEYSLSVLKTLHLWGKKKLQEPSADQVRETSLWVKPTLYSINGINPLVLELSA